MRPDIPLPTALRLDRILIAAWFVAALGLIVSLVLDRTLLYGSTSCELIPGTSFYGEQKWSWLPLGPTCTYGFTDLPGREYTTGPTTALVWLQAAVIAGGVGYLIARTRGRGSEE